MNEQEEKERSEFYIELLRASELTGYTLKELLDIDPQRKVKLGLPLTPEEEALL